MDDNAGPKTDLVGVTATLQQGDAVDVFPVNDTRADTVHLAVPMLYGTVDTLRGADLRVNVPFSAQWQIRNLSAHATAPASVLTVCIWYGGTGCTRNTISGRSELAPIPPGGSLQGAGPFIITPSAAYQGSATNAGFSLCIMKPDDLRIYFRYTETPHCFGNVGHGYLAGASLVRPDYAACQPPVLLPNERAQFNGGNCGIYPARAGYSPYSPFVLAVLDVIDGQQYLLDGLPGRRSVYDEGGEPVFSIDRDVVFTAPATGQFYLPLFDQFPQSLTLLPR